MINFRTEKRLNKKTNKIIVGMDEAGRGPIAGPVAVGAVLCDCAFYKSITSNDKWLKKVNDSKKLSPDRREKIYQKIQNKMLFGVGFSSAKIIDRYGINKAIERAAKKALKKLNLKPDLILLDGNRKFIKRKTCKQQEIKKGDARIFSIACASIMAKVARDRLMKSANERWPGYGFLRHKGYGTEFHLKRLKRLGPCLFHRMSYAPLKNREFRKSFGGNQPKNA